MITLSLCAFAFDEVVQWRYGTVGALAIACVTVGHKLHKPVCTAVGIVALVLLLAQ
jgi:hypothetical protein